MINEWDQNHGKDEDVQLSHVKFHVHPIKYENFTNEMGTCVTQSQHLTRQGRKISNKWKMPQIIPRKFTCKLDIQEQVHAKKSSHLEVKNHGNENHEVAHQWCDTNCHTLIQKFITHKPDKINSKTLHQNHHECVQFKHKKFGSHWIHFHHFTNDLAKCTKFGHMS